VSLAPPTSPPHTKNPTPFCHILVLPHCHRPRRRSLHKMPRFSLPFALRRPENSAPTFIPHYITWFLVGGFLSHRSVGSWQSAKFSWSPWCNSLTRGKRRGYDGCKIILCPSGTAISTCEPQRGVMLSNNRPEPQQAPMAPAVSFLSSLPDTNRYVSGALLTGAPQNNTSL